ncbi:glycosyltransferase family 4 protein [Skermanella stibiiresistens]|nr:glycosyltransferase family 4 protein [Skermanella stibiiresistens]
MIPNDVLVERSTDAIEGVRPPLTRFMRLLWAARPDVRRTYDLSTPEGQRSFVWWYFFQGVGEHGFSRFVTDEQKRLLNEPHPEVPNDTVMPITRLMVETWTRRPDIQGVFPIGTPAGRASFLAWFFTNGVAEMKLLGFIDAAVARALMLPAESPPILELVRAARSLGGGRSSRRMGAPLRGWVKAVLGELGVARAHDREAAALATPLDEGIHPGIGPLRLLAGTSPTETPMPAPKIRRNLEFGVNLIGYARGQFGIGEDVRMAARAMRAAGVPCAIHNIDPGPEVCQGDRSADALITADLPYATNLFCSTGMEMAQQAARRGSALFDGRRTIGYWPWELPEWPDDWRHAYDLIDEVWASSRYTYDAFVKSCPKPVRHMPMAVSVDETAGLGRRDFGLGEDRFLFVFSFDALSHHTRKNPLACVRAFKQAFPRGDEPVGLIVKAMRASHAPARWSALEEEIRSDARVTIISRTLDRGELLDLYRSCDCLMSLHRSEGFGRNIAEAMMLGKPVIVTGHSGNMDFTTPGTAALVDHHPCRVGKDEYPFGEGMSWAEPDAGHAAWWMRRLISDQRLSGRLAEQGRALVLATYSPEIVGAAYAAALKERVT